MSPVSQDIGEGDTSATPHLLLRELPPKFLPLNMISCPTSHQLHQNCLKEAMTAIPVLIRWLKSIESVKLYQLPSLFMLFEQHRILGSSFVKGPQVICHLLVHRRVKKRNWAMDCVKIQGLGSEGQRFQGQRGCLSPCFPSGLGGETPKPANFIYCEVATMK